MEILISWFILIMIGVIIGWKLREYHATRVINDMLEDMIEDENKPGNVVTVNIERHGDQLFVYRKHDGAYMAHGKDKKTLENILQEKYPKTFFNATNEDLRKLRE